MNSIDSNSRSTTVVVFGASGNLTQRKLTPALYNDYKKRRLPERIRIIGVARRDWSDNQFRDRLRDGVRQYTGASFDDDTWNEFATSIRYLLGNLDKPEDYRRLESYLDGVERGSADRLYYLATAPEFYGPACDHLATAGMTTEEEGWRRIIIEKPFGHDLASAQDLNRRIHAAFREDQIYRIDHYLGKETAQNILFLRFARWKGDDHEEPFSDASYLCPMAGPAGRHGKAGWGPGV